MSKVIIGPYVYHGLVQCSCGCKSMSADIEDDGCSGTWHCDDCKRSIMHSKRVNENYTEEIILDPQDVEILSIEDTKVYEEIEQKV